MDNEKIMCLEDAGYTKADSPRGYWNFFQKSFIEPDFIRHNNLRCIEDIAKTDDSKPRVYSVSDLKYKDSIITKLKEKRYFEDIDANEIDVISKFKKADPPIPFRSRS